MPVTRTPPTASTSTAAPRPYQGPCRGPAIVTLRGTVAEVKARQVSTGISLVVLHVLVIRWGKSSQVVDDFEIVAWGDLAEKTAQHLKPGEIVSVKARLTSQWFTDSQGRRRYQLKLTATEISR